MKLSTSSLTPGMQTQETEEIWQGIPANKNKNYQTFLESIKNYQK